ncbi:MAG: substrate-binding domain-containing protein [Deltaproteobacteria bacterium]|jgi:simple sugar transport system substrate-binding protein|nr:substrate-binding domain-containing protein [Deltaproteobacteria bacterium]
MKFKLVFLLAALVAFGLVGTSPTMAQDLIKIGLINADPNESGYRKANVESMTSALSKENGFDVSVAYSERKVENQIAAAQQFINEGVKYLVISPEVSTGWDSVAQSAKEAGVKVIAFDRVIEMPDDVLVASTVSDMRAEGDKAVKWLEDKKLPVYNIIHIQGQMGTDAQVKRSAALTEAAKAKGWNLVAQQTASWSEEDAKQVVQAVIDAKKEFNVIYAENDNMAAGAVAALDANGITHGKTGEVIIIGFDANQWALKEVLAGNWNLDVECNPLHGPLVAQIIKDLEAGKKVDKVRYIEEQAFDTDTITQAVVDGRTYGFEN